MKRLAVALIIFTVVASYQPNYHMLNWDVFGYPRIHQVDGWLMVG